MADYGLEWHGKEVFTLATKANIKAMEVAAKLVEEDVKKHFTGVGGGAVGKEKERRAKGGKAKYGGASPRSKPGKPPAVQTGILMSSIMSEVSVDGMNVTGKVGPDVEMIATKAKVGTDVNYGLYLELGTSKMAPRPYLRPALVRTRKQIKKIFRNANK